MDGKVHWWEFADIAWSLKDEGKISEEDAMGAEMWWWDNHGESADRDGMADSLIMLAEHEGEEMVADILHTIDGHIPEMHWDSWHKGYNQAWMDMHMMHDDHHHDGASGTDTTADKKLAAKGKGKAKGKKGDGEKKEGKKLGEEAKGKGKGKGKKEKPEKKGKGKKAE